MFNIQININEGNMLKLCPDVCLQVSPGVGNLLEAKKSNICRLFRHLAILFTRACVLRTMIAN